MSSADRLVVPLNSMCSMKCEMPFCSGDSRREPEPIQMPTETLRTCGMTSVMIRTPLSSVLISISRNGLVGGVIEEERKEPTFICSTFTWVVGRRAAFRLDLELAHSSNYSASPTGSVEVPRNARDAEK